MLSVLFSLNLCRTLDLVRVTFILSVNACIAIEADDIPDGGDAAAAATVSADVRNVESSRVGELDKGPFELKSIVDACTVVGRKVDVEAEAIAIGDGDRVRIRSSLSA